MGRALFAGRVGALARQWAIENVVYFMRVPVLLLLNELQPLPEKEPILIPTQARKTPQ